MPIRTKSLKASCELPGARRRVKEQQKRCLKTEFRNTTSATSWCGRRGAVRLDTELHSDEALSPTASTDSVGDQSGELGTLLPSTELRHIGQRRCEDS